MNKRSKLKKSLGYLEISKSHCIYQICDVSINRKEIILSTLTTIAP